MLLKKKTGEDLHPHQKCVFLKTKRADIVNLLKKPEKNKLWAGYFKPEKWGMRKKATNNP
jgi:tRNA/tmRNA/rRNA uracil-C5-methylase (TrmA/RlmC/RlmD family)